MEKNNLTTHYVNHPFKVTKPLSKHLKPRGNAEVSDVSSTLGQVEEPKAFVMFSSFPKSLKFDVVTEKKRRRKKDTEACIFIVQCTTESCKQQPLIQMFARCMRACVTSAVEGHM